MLFAGNFVEPNYSQVVWTLADSPLYDTSPAVRAMMAERGKIGFRTCYRTAYIPIEYLVSLMRADYTQNSEPYTWEDAVDHWLLCECLGAIGGHTVA